jgi:hypothetical protein
MFVPQGQANKENLKQKNYSLLKLNILLSELESLEMDVKIS